METTPQLNGAQFERSGPESRDQLKRLIRRVWRKLERIQPLLLNKQEARLLTSISNYLSMLEIEVDREIETAKGSLGTCNEMKNGTGNEFGSA
jgi:hypothetical protein